MSKDSKKYRFAPKVYGRWFVPTSREGWIIVLLIVVAVLVAAPIILWSAEDSFDLGSGTNHWFVRNLMFFLFVLLIAVAPILLLKKHMKWTLKWRRGKKDIDW